MSIIPPRSTLFPYTTLFRSQEHRSAFPMFERFFNWYAPYFEAYSFVLARAQEYEADRCSVLVSGKENSARALINRSEEHTSELQSRLHLVCRLLLEKKKTLY